MSEKVENIHQFVSGVEVARMIQDFYRHFDGVYGHEVMISSLCAVGPLQSMIGLAIATGKLRLSDSAAQRHGVIDVPNIP
jgi:hypothetical protein